MLFQNSLGFLKKPGVDGGAYIRDGLNVVLYLHYVSPLDSRSYSAGSIG
jgi:hypothetical protein